MSVSPASRILQYALAGAVVFTAACTEEQAPTEPALVLGSTSRVLSSDDRLPLVIVKHGAAVQAQGAIVGSIASALDRVRPGGTIRIHDGNYPIAGLRIDKPVTIQAATQAQPVLDAGTAPQAFYISWSGPGVVTLRGLHFRNGTSNQVAVGEPYDRVVVEKSLFDIPAGAIGVEVTPAGTPANGRQVTISQNTFVGGFRGVGIGPGVPDVEVLNNWFQNQSHSGPWGIAIGFSPGASGRIEGNVLSDCVNTCISFGAEGFEDRIHVDVVGNRITINSGAAVSSTGIFAAGGTANIHNNTITGVGPSGFGSPVFEAITVRDEAVVSLRENQITNAQIGISIRGAGSADGRDNVIESVGVGIFAEGNGKVVLRFNDILTASTAISVGHAMPTLTMTCNWWGSPGGPQNIAGPVPAEAYSPWALQPVARMGAVSC